MGWSRLRRRRFAARDRVWASSSLGGGGGEMKILICTKRDLTSLVAMNVLLPALRGHKVHVMLAERTRPVEESTPELVQVKFVERDFPIGVVEPFVEQLVALHSDFDEL